MTATTTIKCTKSEFKDRLIAEFPGVKDTWPGVSELSEVINGLVRQANEHRGTFAGHSAFLALDFEVTPDDAPIQVELTESGKAKVQDLLKGRQESNAESSEYQPSTVVLALVERLDRVCSNAYNNRDYRMATRRMAIIAVDIEMGATRSWAQARDWVNAKVLLSDVERHAS